MNQQQTTTLKGTKAVRTLEAVQATYNGDNTYSVNLWNFDENKCEHFTVTCDKRHTEFIFPNRIATLASAPAMKKWMSK